MEPIEIAEAVATLQSVINKLEKCEPKLKEGSAQVTLLKKRLQTFDLSMSLLKMYSNLIAEQQKTAAILEEMKADGKEKTVRYRELFGQKMMNKSMLDTISQAVGKK